MDSTVPFGSLCLLEDPRTALPGFLAVAFLVSTTPRINDLLRVRARGGPRPIVRIPSIAGPRSVVRPREPESCARTSFDPSLIGTGDWPIMRGYALRAAQVLSELNCTARTPTLQNHTLRFTNKPNTNPIHTPSAGCTADGKSSAATARTASMVALRR